MKLSVMVGTGNVFAVADGFADELPADPAALARRLCADRSREPALDGLLLIARPETGGDCRMIVHNADGSRPESCGNGLRCVARAMVERGHVRSNDVRIETDAGLRRARVLRSDSAGGAIEAVTVAMGLARVEGGVRLETSFGRVEASVVDVGNPHCIVFVDDEQKVPVAAHGAELERHEAFPARTNVEFVAVRSHGLGMRVWERGVGETAACGTGACAAAVAAAHAGAIQLPVDVFLPGGSLHIGLDADGEILMTGPCEELGTIETALVPGAGDSL